MSSGKQVLQTSLKGLLENKSVIAGIDISMRNTGLCVIDKTYTNIKEFVKFCNVKSEKKDYSDTKARHTFILKSILSYISSHNVEAVLIEGASFNSKSSTYVQLMELYGIVKHVLRNQLNFPLIIVPPTTVKRIMTGKGNCGKDLVVSVARQKLARYGIELPSLRNKYDDNAADAFSLAYIGYMASQHEKSLKDLELAVSYY